MTTFFSGIVNENDLVTLGGHPGEPRKVTGIWAEEIDALLPGQQNQINMKQDWGRRVEVIHVELCVTSSMRRQRRFWRSTDPTSIKARLFSRRMFWRRSGLLCGEQSGFAVPAGISPICAKNRA